MNIDEIAVRGSPIQTSSLNRGDQKLLIGLLALPMYFVCI